MKIAVGIIIFLTGIAAAGVMMSQNFGAGDWFYPVIAYTGMFGLIIGPTLVFVEIGKRS